MNPRLLVTDPDTVLLQIFRAYFPHYSLDVATARDGLECVEALRTFAPDVLVLSLELHWGGADGVLSMVREESQMRPIPVILTVGEINRTRAVEYLRPPVVKLLEKPFRLRDLRAIVADALHTHVQYPTAGVAPAPAQFEPSQFANADAVLISERNSLTTHTHQEETRYV